MGKRNTTAEAQTEATPTEEIAKPVEAEGLYQALFAIQTELEGITKDSTNPHFKSEFADRTTVLQTLRPLYEKYGLLLIQAPTTPPVQFNEPVLALETSIVHVKTGQCVKFTAVVPLPKSDPQGFGSAMTYTSRYSLVSFHALPLLDDDGNAGSNLGNARKTTTNSGAAVQTTGTSTGKSTQKTSSASSAEKGESTAKQDDTQTSPSEQAKEGTKPAAASGGKRKLWGQS